MKLSVIVTTYNRPVKVLELIDQLKKSKSLLNEILIIDSSDISNDKLANDPEVVYLKSNHKNQPYQRFLGYMKSYSDILLYLDDDMEILDPTIFQDVKELFTNEEIVGVGLAFRNKHEDTFLNKTPKSAWQKFNKTNGVFQKLRSFTGYGELPAGKFGWNGVRGRQPIEIAPTEWFSGGAFAARRSELFQNFNFQLFDLFEQRIGMGEDMLISYSLSKRGRVLYYPQIKFLHNDQKNSTYTPDFFSYAFRVMYSRLFLSLEYARLNNHPSYLAQIKFHWYASWRVLGQLINVILKPSKDRKETLKGSINGWIKTFSLNIKESGSRNHYWNTEANLNLTK